jgi:hypothetical protein
MTQTDARYTGGLGVAEGLPLNVFQIDMEGLERRDLDHPGQKAVFEFG